MRLPSARPNLIKQQTTDWGNPSTKKFNQWNQPYHLCTAGVGYENLNQTDSGGDKLRMLLPAVLHRVRHHAADPVPTQMLCDLFKNAILLCHIDGDGNFHPGTAATFSTSKFRTSLYRKIIPPLATTPSEHGKFIPLLFLTLIGE